MITSSRARLAILAGAGSLALAACGLQPDSSPSASDRSGPKPAWSMTVPTGESTTVQAGTTLAIRDDQAISGVDMRAGKRLWRVPNAGDTTMVVAGNVVARQTINDLTMIDAVSGKKLWTYTFRSDKPTVTQDAVFTVDCPKHGTRCTIARRDPRTGHIRWRTHGARTGIGDEYVGVRAPVAPPTGRYIASDFTAGHPATWGARVTATGRQAGGHVASHAWYTLVAGRNLIGTDHDPPAGDDRCTVRLYANDVVTGKHRWTRTVYSAREKDGECAKQLSPLAYDDTSAMPLIGAGTRIAAVTSDGRPQLFDLRTGRTVWQGKSPGAPMDGDGHGVLVRAQYGTGKISMLDFATGRVRWTAPDPGLETSSASWQTAVAGHLVAVSGAVSDGAGKRPYVLVYDSATGKRLGRFPGWLEGLGGDWVAVGHSGDSTDIDHLKYDFVRL